MRRWTTLIVRAAVLIAISTLTAAGGYAQNTLGRDSEPIVLKGTDVPMFVTLPLWAIKAYYSEDGVLYEIPLQIDEMAEIDFGTIYNTDPTGFTILTYTDTTTFTGPDPDTLLDWDDELVFMARDAGTETGMQCPITPDCPSHYLVTLIHPDTGDSAYVYLVSHLSLGWCSTVPMDPPLDYVDYDFDLLSGDYKTTYNTEVGPNPENTTITTVNYSVHFSDRWIRDETGVTAGGAPGTDILDRHKNLFAPGNCSRSEDTFSAGEGAFIVNKDGCIRSLRGYVGANSGPTTYRIHAFYNEREDIFTALRVHAISGIMDFFDYSPDASGMTYVNDLAPSGVVIDGSPDAMPPITPYIYEGVTGPQGTMAYHHHLNNDIGILNGNNYYLDDLWPTIEQCTGDVYAYGSSGMWFDMPIPNTDPYVGEYNIFEHTRSIRYLPPSQPLTFAGDWHDERENPLIVELEFYQNVSADEHEPGDMAGIISLMTWPNPVSGSLQVRFSTRRAGHVDITLFDVLGRRVMNLVEGQYGVGDFTASRNVSSLAPGVYFARAMGPGGAMRSVRVIIMR
jgi:hypothetical protein